MLKFEIKEVGDGTFEYDGCNYENLEDVIQTGILGFCGCGDPSGNLDYIQKCLEHLTMERHGDDYKPWCKKMEEIYGGEYTPSAYFMWYVLSKHDITEHGGSVPGWLTDKGKALLGLLQSRKVESENKE